MLMILKGFQLYITDDILNHVIFIVVNDPELLGKYGEKLNKHFFKKKLEYIEMQFFHTKPSGTVRKCQFHSSCS